MVPTLALIFASISYFQKQFVVMHNTLWTMPISIDVKFNQQKRILIFEIKFSLHFCFFRELSFEDYNIRRL